MAMPNEIIIICWETLHDRGIIWICFFQRFPTRINEGKIIFFCHFFNSYMIFLVLKFKFKLFLWRNLTKFIYRVFFSLKISNDFQRKSTKLKSRFFIIFEHVHYFFSVKIKIQRFFFSLKISNENQRSKLGS